MKCRTFHPLHPAAAFPARRAFWMPAIAVLFAAVGACAESPSAPAQLNELPRELTSAEREVIAGNNQFAFGLLREASRQGGGGNLLLSPLSASMALGMTMNGARGETQREMRSALGFDGLELEQINHSYRQLLDLLGGLDPKVDTRLANSLWYRETFPFDRSFFDVVRESFSAEVTPLQMVSSDGATINAWVSQATGGKIREIVDEIRDTHVMLLINAVYFKGEWTRRFDRSATRDDRFQLADGRTAPVKMMRGRGSYGVGGSDGMVVVDVPYGNGAYSMTVLLPSGHYSVDELVESLDDARWAEITGSLRRSDMDLSMPRFRLEYERNLNEVLGSLGLVSAFRPGMADFSGMSSAAGRSLFVSSVLQKTYLEVNEEGTEAAAATSVEMERVSVPASVRIDRPFVFAIRERFSGTILFIGKMVEPS